MLTLWPATVARLDKRALARGVSRSETVDRLAEDDERRADVVTRVLATVAGWPCGMAEFGTGTDCGECATCLAREAMLGE